jgi:hypothetical protein
VKICAFAYRGIFACSKKFPDAPDEAVRRRRATWLAARNHRPDRAAKSITIAMPDSVHPLDMAIHLRSRARRRRRRLTEAGRIVLAVAFGAALLAIIIRVGLLAVR